MRFTWPYDRERWVSEILKYDNALMRRIARPLVPYLTRKQGTGQGLARRSEADILEELKRHARALGALLDGRDFLVGESLTLADIAVSQLECVAGSGRGLDVLRSEPAILPWMERVEALTEARLSGETAHRKRHFVHSINTCRNAVFGGQRTPSADREHAVICRGEPLTFPPGNRLDFKRSSPCPGATDRRVASRKIAQFSRSLQMRRRGPWASIVSKSHRPNVTISWRVRASSPRAFRR